MLCCQLKSYLFLALGNDTWNHSDFAAQKKTIKIFKTVSFFPSKLGFFFLSSIWGYNTALAALEDLGACCWLTGNPHGHVQTQPVVIQQDSYINTAAFRGSYKTNTEYAHICLYITTETCLTSCLFHPHPFKIFSLYFDQELFYRFFFYLAV